jgi:hypothetical protein
VHLHGFAGLGARSLRARPLGSGLTMAGIVLGVGMAFGVLVLVTTIHSSFDRLFDAIYGNTSAVVTGRSSVGQVPQRTLGEVREVDGVDAAVGRMMGIFRVIGDEGKAQAGSSSTPFVAGENLRGPRQIQLEQSWAAAHGLEVGDRLWLATPSGRANLLVAGIFRFDSSLDLGGYGMAAAPLGSVRRMTGKPSGWDEISVIAAGGIEDQALSRRIRAAVGPGSKSTPPRRRAKK